jgi:Fic family protein
MTADILLYTHPAAMEPLMPDVHKAEMAELTCEIFRKAGALSATVSSDQVRAEAARLVREMNSYYSNLIEGHKTLPQDIERAMRQDFSKDPKKRGNQHLNRAHIEVETLMTRRLESEPDLSIHSAEFISWLHREFYQRLPADLHWSENKGGEKYKIEPGALRTFGVDVGAHHPPHHEVLPRLLSRFSDYYGEREILATDRLIALAAAHHRLTWIHPFGDGNGRVTRLYSHACLVRARIDGFGLWTLSRGLARQRSAYYAALSAADQQRRNDLDGRGNLSDRALGDFCRFVLGVILDQINFMAGLLQFETLSKRIEHYLRFQLIALKAKERE